jgi:hypothetical protein
MMNRTYTVRLLKGLVYAVGAFAAASAALAPAAEIASQTGPDPVFFKPTPITMSELARRTTEGVSAVEVNDYVFGNFKGELAPSPPHADLNPRKAVVVFWKDHSHRMVFSHEASYVPMLVLADGVSLQTEFLEGNHLFKNGKHIQRNRELFNQLGRRERNSFVDVIESGPRRVWVRWTYFCVDMDDDRQPALRGTEDYIAYPNGLVWRRLTYQSLMPESDLGYSIEPLELLGVFPVGIHWRDALRRDPLQHDAHVLAALDAFSGKRYDTYRDATGARRTGCRWREIEDSPGKALVLPAKAGLLFCAFGDASGFAHETTKLADHAFPDTGGLDPAFTMWLHWPVGWVNSQGLPDSPEKKGYLSRPYHTSSCVVHMVRSTRDESASVGFAHYIKNCEDREVGRRTERSVYYCLLGVGKDFEEVRQTARRWLDQGVACACSDSIARLRDSTPR